MFNSLYYPTSVWLNERERTFDVWPILSAWLIYLAVKHPIFLDGELK